MMTADELDKALKGVLKDAEKLQYSPGFLEKIEAEYKVIFCQPKKKGK